MPSSIKALIFDWGDTLMRNFAQYQGPMVEWPYIEIIPGAETALAELHQHYQCCVASNAAESSGELMAQALARVNLRQYFRRFFTSRDLGVGKPDPQFYVGVAHRIGLKPSQCIMIGNDYQMDIAPAKTAGMMTVWLASSALGSAICADAIIESLDELPEVVVNCFDGAPFGD
jgi:HAD superfamily hydrolase (TIGR01509 family)